MTASELTFDAPGGESLLLREVQVDVQTTGEQLTEVVLTLVISREDWDRVDAGGWFNMPPEVRGPTFGGAFAPEKPIEIEARLAESALALVALLCEDTQEIGAALGPDGPPELRSTEAWKGMYVKQEMMPGLKVGFHTSWSGL